MNVDGLFEELDKRGVPAGTYLLFRQDGGGYGHGDITQLVLKPVGNEWEVGTKDQASYDPEARFSTEDDACRYMLERLTHKPPSVPVHHPTPDDDVESQRITEETVNQYLKEMRARGFKV